MPPTNTITLLLRRVIVFLSLFIIITGATGPRIIHSTILFRDGFWIYGGIGKGIIFGLVAFLLLARRNSSFPALQPWRIASLGWIAGAGLCFVIAWISIGNLLAGKQELYSLVGAHAGLLLTLTFAGIGCMGIKNIQLLWRSYRLEIIRSFILAISFYAFLYIVYMLWRPLAAIVLVGVVALLGLTGLHAAIVPPYTLLFDKFGITIAEFCSGVESIALFTGLYGVVGLLDWKRLNKRRYFVVFPLRCLYFFCLISYGFTALYLQGITLIQRLPLAYFIRTRG